MGSEDHYAEAQDTQASIHTDRLSKGWQEYCIG